MNTNNLTIDLSLCNDAQKQAITTTDGPVLITAGPGTGKTFTLVQRALFLITEKGVKPEQILMATFTEKAAKELVTRISNELSKYDIPVNINEMYIGTFHSICLRIIKENLEYTRLKKNYKTLDDFDQKYTVFQNVRRFWSIPGYDLVANKQSSQWEQAKSICSYVNNLTEELVDIEKLIIDSRPKFSALGAIIKLYKELMEEKNFLDFSSIQTETYWLLNTYEDVLSEIQGKIKYLMIDEYQDTNYIQEQLVFLLAGENKNICVVGDDDQGLYRFRGATIRNILEFPEKFDDKECRIIKLVTNYRSSTDIVKFYNDWMKFTECDSKHKFEWDKFRHDKTIIPHTQEELESAAVIRISSDNDEKEWHKKNYDFIKLLFASGKVTDLNQIAFLFNSVKNDKAVRLARYLEECGVNVYSPRSDMFFERHEIKMVIGCLLLCFQEFEYNIQDRNFKFVDEQLCKYYESCMELAGEYLETDEGSPLAEMIATAADYHSFMKKNTDYAFSGLLYQMFEFEPFASILSSDMNNGVVDLRPARNLSLMSSILAKYEYLHRVDVFTPKKIEKDVELFFNLYMKLLMRGGIDEYEDDSEYAPSGCVSFLTIHQSKGMEFPIVIVGSLSNCPRARNNGILDELAERYYKRPPFEPYADIKYFDFWRLYYTAFSRAQNLLVLSGNVDKREPSLYFREIFNALPSYDSNRFNVNAFDFELVKDVNIKETYSFTSHISVYEECSRQYKFFKELGFTPIRVGATIFGTIVHQTIEDIHKAALRNEEHLITKDNIKEWFEINYATVSKAEHSYLGKPQIEAALRQVEAYVENRHGDWSMIKDAEVDVSLVKPDYILSGKIDLIQGEGNSVEILDFKSEKKPEIVAGDAHIERYKKQLQVYAHLVEERTGQNVSKLILYYTGDESKDSTITFSYNKEDVTATIVEFDNIVHKIKQKKFDEGSLSPKTCNNCDFRYYCHKQCK